MTYTFAKAEPVTIKGTGRKSHDNPFTDAVASIAWKNDPKTKKPLALAFFEEHDGQEKTISALKSKIRRLMREAGSALETPGTVRTNFDDREDGTHVTFWVVKLQERPREKN